MEGIHGMSPPDERGEGQKTLKQSQKMVCTMTQHWKKDLESNKEDDHDTCSTISQVDGKEERTLTGMF